MSRLFQVASAALLAAGLCAHQTVSTKLTWTREISRIVYKRCVSCHRPGGSAPMSLLHYQQARPWAKAIKEEVLERRMPPWGAVKGFGDFKDDQGLTQEELHLIADWVEGGAPKGDDRYLPDPPGPLYPPPAPPQGGPVVSKSLRLTQPLRLEAVAPLHLPQGRSLRAVAVLPDGGVIPLLWLHNYQPRFRRVYEYRQPIPLPAGARLHVIPPAAGTLQFYTATAKRAPSR